jgi:cysteinyl-tRNA synthetase
MPLRIYNTLSQKKEDFSPIESGKVRMYVCGITAYDLCHVGHARAIIVFDAIYRYLGYLGYDVTFVQNFTDVDDKIINRANQEGRSASEIAERYIKEFFDDIKNLNVKEPSVRPRVIAHIPEIISLIKKIIENGKAYEMEGDVYFSVRSFPGYGKLSGKNIEELEAGARVEIGEKKKDPLDFTLWKKAKPGEPKWASPWGEGRPGWHIECSAMSRKYLGDTFDIHGGGQDLIFPHHENEIAQAEAATGKPFVKYWLHNGFVNINKEKMSKSLGNFFTIRELLKIHHPETLRLFLLSTHYRSPIDFSIPSMDESKARLDRLNVTRRQIEEIMASKEKLFEITRSNYSSLDLEVEAALNSFDGLFREAMDDDFNTALAIAHLFDLARNINRWIEKAEKVPSDLIKKVADVFKKVGDVFGIFKCPTKEWFQQIPTSARQGELSPEKIESLITQREEARRQKNWARADEIRKELTSKGIQLEDTSRGTVWRRG